MSLGILNVKHDFIQVTPDSNLLLAEIHSKIKTHKDHLVHWQNHLGGGGRILHKYYQ